MFPPTLVHSFRTFGGRCGWHFPPELPSWCGYEEWPPVAGMKGQKWIKMRENRRVLQEDEIHHVDLGISLDLARGGLHCLPSLSHRLWPSRNDLGLQAGV